MIRKFTLRNNPRRVIDRPLRTCAIRPSSRDTSTSALASVTSMRAIASLPSGACGFGTTWLTRTVPAPFALSTIVPAITSGTS